VRKAFVTSTKSAIAKSTTVIEPCKQRVSGQNKLTAADGGSHGCHGVVRKYD
jgi:hypothetical protein